MKKNKNHAREKNGGKDFQIHFFGRAQHGSNRPGFYVNISFKNRAGWRRYQLLVVRDKNLFLPRI
jgi:hypothetical protein